MNNSALRRSVSTRLRGLGASVFIGCCILPTLANLALGFVLELFFFFLLFRQFFLTLLVSVIRCCQSMLSSYGGTLPFSSAVARTTLHFLSYECQCKEDCSACWRSAFKSEVPSNPTENRTKCPRFRCRGQELRMEANAYGTTRLIGPPQL
jgi:hypothetical protein